MDCAETSTGETVCFPVWTKYTITGCTRRFEQWNGCPVDYDSVPADPDPDPAAWDWSCLDPA